MNQDNKKKNNNKEMSGNISDFLNSLSFSTWKHPTEFFNPISELLNS